MKYTRIMMPIFVLLSLLVDCIPAYDNRDVLFQTVTINALLAGVYDGDMTCEELKKHGDMGIGTFNGLDGEMVELNGVVYQIKSDGTAALVDDAVKTPFAVITFFEPDKTVALDSSFDCKHVEEYLDKLLPTTNIFYALKIDGTFTYAKTRSVPKQNKPYPPLVEVVKNQPVFELHGVRGTIIGFRLPEFVKGINVPGYHFHFITEDKKAGGHLLECRLQKATAEIDYSAQLHLVLPGHGDFYKIDLSGEKRKELEKVER